MIGSSLRVPYKEEMSMYGLDGYRFQADEMMFAAPETNPDNWCYCNGECPPAGELETWTEGWGFLM